MSKYSLPKPSSPFKTLGDRWINRFPIHIINSSLANIGSVKQSASQLCFPDVCCSACCVADSVIGRLIFTLASLVARHVILRYLDQTISVVRRSLLTAVGIGVFNSFMCLAQ